MVGQLRASATPRDALAAPGRAAMSEPRAGSLQVWSVALRGRAALLVAWSPVLVGSALGFARAGHVDVVAAALVLGAALLMQLITNPQNDVGYTVRGGERGGEHGTKRRPAAPPRRAG